MTNNQTLCHSAIIRQYFRRKKLGKQFLVLLLVTITCFSYCAGTTRHTATAHDVPGILRGIQTTTALTTSGECQSIQYSYSTSGMDNQLSVVVFSSSVPSSEHKTINAVDLSSGASQDGLVHGSQNSAENNRTLIWR